MEEQIRTQSGNTDVVDKERDKKGLGRTKIKRNTRKSIKQHILACYDNFNRTSIEVKERERTPLEKVVWSLIFLICLTYCGYLIWESYMKWKKSPSVVLLSGNAASILMTPFPAITVCPLRKIREEVFSFKKYDYTNGNLTEDEKNMYEDMCLLCEYCDSDIKGRKFSLGNKTVSNIKKSSRSLPNVMQLCDWKGKKKSCSDMFTPILTEVGICYTFNMVGPEDLFRSDKLNTDYDYMPHLNRTRLKQWTMKHGYPKDMFVEDTYPERGSGAGARFGLKLILGEDQTGLDLDCTGIMSGFKISLHHPSELPRLTQHYFRVPIFEEVTIAFTPKQIVTSNGLRGFTPEGRQCYYTEDRKLKYFKLYTQSNCEYECLTNFTYARCDCVQFSMPHGPGMKICNIGSQNCTDHAEIELSTLSITRTLEQGSSNVTVEEAIKIADDCKCLPTCTSTTYDTEISQLQLDYREEQRHALKWHGFRLRRSVKLSSVVIYFKHALYNISKRSELYSTADILASCGGLLGLFMGFSVINIIETLYFCILRAYRQRKNQAEKNEDSDEEAVQDSVEKY